MRAVHLLLIAISLLAATGIAGAQTRVDIERCRAISDTARRLACYDAIPLAPSRSKYSAVALDELMDFALSYRGDLVEVSGWIAPGDDIFRLSQDAADERSIPVDVQRLSRQDRQAFLGRCGDGCQATVQGMVSPVNFTTGIVADALIIN